LVSAAAASCTYLLLSVRFNAAAEARTIAAKARALDAAPVASGAS